MKLEDSRYLKVKKMRRSIRHFFGDDHSLRLEFQYRYSGITLRVNNTFYSFFWKPYSDGYVDKDGKWHKSKRFQFLTYTIR